MSREEHCWNNAVPESFFATLEIELMQDEDWHTRNEASVPSSSSSRYDTTASAGTPSLKYLTPAEFDKRLRTRCPRTGGNSKSSLRLRVSA
jgi:hypothetical protein